MSKDLRDPKSLGRAMILLGQYHGISLRHALESTLGQELHRVVNYDANPGTLEKYGDPRQLPSTLPN